MRQLLSLLVFHAGFIACNSTIAVSGQGMQCERQAFSTLSLMQISTFQRNSSTLAAGDPLENVTELHDITPWESTGPSVYSGMDLAALVAPAAMCLAFLLGDTFLACRVSGHDVPASEGSTPAVNWVVLRWANIAVGFTYINITCIITVAAQQFSQRVDSLALAGIWVGLYGIGGLLSLPLFWQIPPEKARVGLSLYAGLMFCGNAIILLGDLNGFMWPMYLGRLTSGMAFGVKFFVDTLNLSIMEPGRDRTAALMMTRITNGAGMAFGFLVQPSLALLSRVIFPAVDAAQHEEMFGVGLMAVYALIYMVAAALALPKPQEIAGDVQPATDEPTEAQPTKQDSDAVRRQKAKLIFCVLMYFTRSFTQSFQDSVLVILLTYTYEVPAVAGLSNFLLRVSVVFSRMLLLELQDIFGLKYLTRSLEVLQLCVLPFLFVVTKPQVSTFVLFLLAYNLSFNINGTQIAVLAAQSAEYVLPNSSTFFSKRALSLYLFLAVVGVHFLGPVAGFSILDGNLQQNRVAAVLLVVTTFHVAGTFHISGNPSEFAAARTTRGC
mmetsp:Transcript_50148/g.92590  ORF Transcript_50148/g.92590 Transcript_50148/m.92590 type:complete len:552 (+) Transcript_50148:193-1848(+)